jgi:hypothetical protein
MDFLPFGKLHLIKQSQAAMIVDGANRLRHGTFSSNQSPSGGYGVFVAGPTSPYVASM